MNYDGKLNLLDRRAGRRNDGVRFSLPTVEVLRKKKTTFIYDYHNKKVKLTLALVAVIESIDGDNGVNSSCFKNFSNRNRHGLVSFPFVFAGVI